ncbi:MAG: outer membrane beta-barrel protein [Bacteroidales bacterium]|nr:outer membrane beta-barrel protein [Bacteroidales bacterium]
MFLKRIFWLTVCLFTAILMFASDYSVNGRLIGQSGETEPYATLRVFSDQDSIKPVVMATSSDEGQFSLTLPAAGSYRLSAAAVGKANKIVDFTVSATSPVASLGDVVIADADNMLKEVTVSAQRPLVTKEIDRIGYDVQADNDSKTSTVNEILRKVPLVSVEADGTIKVNGSSDFKIYKNGRPNSSFTQNAKDIFKAIPASTIKKIEVITDPGAREDAEGVGAILNIITMQDTSVRGVMGSVGMWLGSNNPIPQPFVWLTSQIDKVTFSVNGGYFGNTGRVYKARSESDMTYDSNGNRLVTSSESDWRRSSGNGGYVQFEMSYDLDSLNLFTAEFGGYSYGSKNPTKSSTWMYAPTGDLIYSFDENMSKSKYSYMDFNGSFNYQHLTHRPKEMITLSYMISTNGSDDDSETEYDKMVNTLFDYTGISAWSHSRFIEHTGQLDWTRPINDKHKFDLGAKFIFRDNNAKGERDYLNKPDSSLVPTKYTHQTSIGAAYFDWRSKFGKFTLRAGLRYEFSRLTSKDKIKDGDNYSANLSDWVPMAAINYAVNDASTIKLSYNTRISRPGISDLNPTRVVTPTSVNFGNPDLSSSLYHTVALNYNIIKRNFNADFSVSYRMSNTGVHTVNWVEDDIMYSTKKNIGQSRKLNIGGYFRWMITQKTNWMMNFGVNHGSIKYAADALNPEMSESGWGGNLFTRISQEIPWKITVGLSIYGWYEGFSGLYNKNLFDVGNIHHSIMLTRNFLKEDRLSTSLFISNPFGAYTTKWKTKYMNGGITGHSVSYNYNQFSVGLSINYRFGSLNAYVKKASRAASNDDLDSSRPSTGGGTGTGN